jgi:hypothetical protein
MHRESAKRRLLSAADSIERTIQASNGEFARGLKVTLPELFRGV